MEDVKLKQLHLLNKYGMPVLNKSPLYEEELQMYRDDPQGRWTANEEGIMAILANVGRCLPAQGMDFTDMSSDAGVARLFWNGCGQIYVQKIGVGDERKKSPTTRMAKSAQRGEGEQPPPPAGSVFEVDFSDLHRHEVRPAFERYGATAYFDRDRALTGIWWCNAGRMICPGEGKAWILAKTNLKACLGTVLTLRDHLLITHWVFANATNTAVREACEPDHPLRRLLNPFSYRTSMINKVAIMVLAPVGGLGFRNFAFTPESWFAFFTAALEDWRYLAFPSLMRAKGLTEEELQMLPLYVDGMKVWDAHYKFVERYFELFYPNGEVEKDQDIIQYWDHFSSNATKDNRGGINWQVRGLPTLTLGSLLEQLTNNIFWVTAGHEHVGAITYALTPPTGLLGRIIKDSPYADIQGHLYSNALVGLTGSHQPGLINNWIDNWRMSKDNEDPTGEKEVRTSVTRQSVYYKGGSKPWHWHGITEVQIAPILSIWQQDLLEVTCEIDVANTKRDPFTDMSPITHEVSVSV